MINKMQMPQQLPQQPMRVNVPLDQLEDVVKKMLTGTPLGEALGNILTTDNSK